MGDPTASASLKKLSDMLGGILTRIRKLEKQTIGADPAFDTVTATNGIVAPSVYNNALSASYRALYINSSGQFGYVSSPERFKTNIATSTHDPAKILQVQVRTYQYVAEVQEQERRAALPPDDPDYDPAYVVQTRLGVIAEELIALGFPDLVFFDDDGSTAGVFYELLGLLALEATQYLAAQITDLQTQVTAITAQLTPEQTSPQETGTA